MNSCYYKRTTKGFNMNTMCLTAPLPTVTMLHSTPGHTHPGRSARCLVEQVKP